MHFCLRDVGDAGFPFSHVICDILLLVISRSKVKTTFIVQSSQLCLQGYMDTGKYSM